MRLVHARDTTSGRETTVKVGKICYPDGSVDLVVHRSGGSTRLKRGLTWSGT